MFKQVIALTALILLVNSRCHADSQLTNLNVGSVQLAINNNDTISTSTFIKTFQNQFTQTPMIGLSIYEFIARTTSLQYWALSTTFITATSLQIKFEYERNLWNKIQVGYWASDRSDLIVGHSSAQLGSVSGSTQVVNFDLARPLQKASEAYIGIFLNGLVSTNAKQISVSLSRNSLTRTKFSANVMVGNSLTVNKVYISYLALSLPTQNFVSYGKTIRQNNFDSNKVYNIHKNIYNTPYVFYGFTSLQVNGDRPIGFSSDLDTQMYLKLSVNRQFNSFSIAYVVAGAAPASVCKNCLGQNFINGDVCVNSCPSQSYRFTYFDYGVGCKKCPAKYGYVINNDRTGCVCRRGFKQSNGICQDQNSNVQTISNTQLNINVQNSFIANMHSEDTSTINTIQAQTKQPTIKPYVQKDCSDTSNTYWTGYRCACKVRYKIQNGICIASNFQSQQEPFRPAEFIYKISKLYTKVQCILPNEVLSGQICICQDGYYRTAQGTCELDIDCPEFSMLINGNCVCMAGFQEINGACLQQCPMSESRNVDGECVCNQGLGKFENVCQQCPSQYFIQNGFCVTCPQNSAYSQIAGACECVVGYTLNSSQICDKICKLDNQIYEDNRCRCRDGLGYQNGVCVVCPIGVNQITLECIIQCGQNQVLLNDVCVCAEGYGYNQLQECINCTTLDQGFLLDGSCAVCPDTFSYNGQQCVCQTGFEQVDGRCLEICQIDQLRDDNGTCYQCGMNEIIVNETCECQQDYERVDQICVLSCDPNEHEINGSCVTCVNGSVFNSTLQDCICPIGTQENAEGVCEIVQLSIACDPAYYHDSQQGCVSCPYGCLQCKSSNQCTKCPQNYVPSQNQCIPNCGDGFVIQGKEKCDDGNKDGNDGCSSICQVEQGWSCSGNRPSICQKNNLVRQICGDGAIDNNEVCDDQNNNNGDGCSSSCQLEDGYSCQGSPSVCTELNVGPVGMKQISVSVNSYNVHAIIETDDLFTFNNESQMKSFMKYEFKDKQTLPAAAYCLQNIAQKKIFQCLFIYPSGIPDNNFKVNFSFNHQDKSGKLTVQIDPNQNAFASRSLH